MASYSKTIVLGRLGQDADLRTTNSGKNVLNFNIATDKWVPGGEKKTLWFRVSVWGQLCERMIDLIEKNGALAKGDTVLVEGEIDYSTYAANDGTTRVNLELNARDIQLIASANRGNN